MDVVLWVVGGLFLGLIWSTWSMSRSFFERGRTRGIRDSVREIRRGAMVILQCDEQYLPADVRDTLSALETLLDRGASKNKLGTGTIDVQLSTLGRTLGEACWLKGHSAGVRRKAPAEGKVRVDLSAVELLQLGGLADLGFQHMMPNARLFDMQRFTGRDDATEAARAVSRLEASIPKQYRPDLIHRAESRRKLIDNWWTPLSDRATA